MVCRAVIIAAFPTCPRHGGNILNPRLLLCLPILLLTACALPQAATPEAAAIRKDQANIRYDEDVKLGNSRTSYDFRSLPERPTQPDVNVDSSRSTEAVVQCLKQQLQTRFRLPDDFLQIRSYTNNVQTVALHNPFTRKDGILMDVHQRGVGSATIKLYANGTTLSRAWRNLPNSCK
ncbi:hypothetical protein H3L94_01720 [Neisseria shayeganii]|uniref:Uncharacterized protein n=1 Tax=Neisseria shayeganii TaxID=607712 RepID=A0A7D7RN71_9NEIS|nr:hypothetical protein H3L94_01720 [Neisseria shayeganii]